MSENLSDSYVVSIDGDRFKDEVRKDTFRGLLQESLVDYAQIVLALNEMSVLMAHEWKAKPDVNMPLKFVSLEIPARAAGTTVTNARLPDDTRDPIDVPAPMTSEGASLEGHWQSITGQPEELNGKPFTAHHDTRRFTFSGNTMIMSRSIDGKYGVYQGTFEADASTRSFDFNGNSPGGNPVSFRGIYKLSGDKLTLCYKYVKDDFTSRPTEFRTDDKAGTTFVLMQLKRTGAPTPVPNASHRSERQAPRRQSVLTEIRILRNGNWIYHSISYESGKTYIARTDGSKAELSQNGESLFFTTITGERFGFDLRKQKTSSGEPASFIYK